MKRTLRQIQEQRAELLDKVQAIMDIANNEDRDLSPEDTQQIDALLAEHDRLAEDEARAQKIEDAMAAAATRRHNQTVQDMTTGEPTPRPGGNPEPRRLPAQPRAHAGELRAFNWDGGDEAAYDCGMWLRAVCLRDSDSLQYCRDRQMDMRFRDEDGRVFRMDAQTVDDNTRGGFLVPTELSRAILAVRDNYGVSRNVSRLIPMASETLNIAKRSAGLTVYSPSEGAAITTSEATWSQVSLTTIDRFTLTRASRKLLRSAVVNVADQVAMEIGQAFGEGQDNEFINGDGSGTYFGETGLVSALGAAGTHTLATGKSVWGNIVLSDFTDTAAVLPERYHNPNTAWIMSRAFWATVVEKLMIAAGGTTTLQIAQGGAPTLLGYPVRFTEKMPTATAVSTVCCVVGDFWNGVVIGERQGTEIALSEHRYFDSDEIGIRGKVSYDINVHGGGDGSNAGAYVGMKTSAT